MNLKIPNLQQVQSVLKRTESNEFKDLFDDEPLTNLDRWAVWVLINLHRYLKMQYWVGRVVTEQLGGDLTKIGRLGASGHPERRSGSVPENPDWQFGFHGRGCVLVNQTDGTMVDVDFIDGKCDSIDRYFFQWYVQSLKTPSLAQKQVWHAEPLVDAWHSDLHTLITLGLLQGDHHIQFNKVGTELAGMLDSVVQKAEQFVSNGEPQRAAALLHAIGDTRLMCEIYPKSDESDRRFSEKVETQRKERLQQLLSRMKGSNSTPADVSALADLGRHLAQTHILELLRNSENSRITAKAIEVVALWDDVDLDPYILNMLGGVRYLTDRNPYLVLACAKVLLRHQHPALKDQLLQFRNDDLQTFAGEIALILYGVDREKGLQRLEECIQSTIPLVRADAVGALLLIQTQQAKDVLLRGMNKQVCRIECCAALLEFPDKSLWEHVRTLSAGWWPLQKPMDQYPTIGQIARLRSPELVRERRTELEIEYGELLSRVR